MNTKISAIFVTHSWFAKSVHASFWNNMNVKRISVVLRIKAQVILHSTGPLYPWRDSNCTHSIGPLYCIRDSNYTPFIWSSVLAVKGKERACWNWNLFQGTNPQLMCHAGLQIAWYNCAMKGASNSFIWLNLRAVNIKFGGSSDCCGQIVHLQTRMVHRAWWMAGPQQWRQFFR